MIPRRDPQFDWNRPLDGADPRTRWNGIHTLAELPQVLNPKCGYVQNCNSSPFTTCDADNPDRGQFPAYLAKDADDDKRRAKMSRELLSAMHDATFEQVQAAAFDTTIYWAKTELPKYAERFKSLESSDPKLARQVEPYLRHLLQWDCRVSADSTQATLCEAWYEELYGFNYPAEQLLPRYRERPDLEFKALLESAAALVAMHGDWRVPWGQVFRIQRHACVANLLDLPFSDQEPSLPSLGVPGPMGAVFTQYCSPSIRIPFLLNLQKRYGLIGATYTAVYEFGDKVQGASAVNFGESGDPASEHFFDQARLLSERKLKPELFDWAEVVAGAKQAYHPGERGGHPAVASARPTAAGPHSAAPDRRPDPPNRPASKADLQAGNAP
jgi:acyl-homoserine lactone acylase PvdQ